MDGGLDSPSHPRPRARYTLPVTAASTFTGLVLTTLLAAPLPVGALYHDVGVPGRSENAPGQRRAATVASTPTPSPDVSPSPTPTPRARLRRPEHAQRLVRVRGLINGMTNTLTNLADRLARHVLNVERRIAALEAAGHDLTVDAELAAVRAVVAETQQMITSIVSELAALPDSETPRQAHQAVRQHLRALRAQLEEDRDAFKALRDAIRDDVRAGRPSPTPAAGGSPLPLLPEESSPSPTP